MVSSRLMTGPHRFPVRARFGKASPNLVKLHNYQVKTRGKSFSQKDDNETWVIGKEDIADAEPHIEAGSHRSHRCGKRAGVPLLDFN
jgi:hypothetical protein